MRDLRRYAQQTTVQLIVGAVLLLFIVGTGLIYWRYGEGAALLGFLCLLGAGVPVLAIIFALRVIDWVVKRANRE
jgi:hypothetical protein